jgi:hypothetical protein
LNVSGNSNFDDITLKSSLFVSGTTRLHGATTINSSLNVVGKTIAKETVLTN